MSYSSVATVRRALVPTLDLATAANVPSQATRTAADFTNDQLQDAITEADAIIDGYIGRFYAVPVMPTVQQIATATLSAPQTANAVLTALPVSATITAIPAGGAVILFDPSTGAQQTFTYSGGAPLATNSTSIPIAQATLAASFVAGSTVGQPGTMAATPNPIGAWSRNIAAYNATLVYRGSLDFTDVDPVARRYKDTLFQLAQVAAGKLQLQLPENTGLQAATGAGNAINPYIGDLFTVDEFSLAPPNFDPVYGARPAPYWPQYPR